MQASPSTAEHPTHKRHWVVGMALVMAVLLYLDRVCISFASPLMQQDLGLSRSDMAWVLSAFFWTYALAQLPAGYLSDRFGVRFTLAGYIAVWSLLTAATGLATGLISLVILRFGFGLAQAGAYPASAALVSRWVPVVKRGGASALVALGGRLGGILAPIVTAALIIAWTPIDVPSQFDSASLLDPVPLAARLLGEEAPPAESVRPADRRRIAARRKIVDKLRPMISASDRAELERLVRAGATQAELTPILVRVMNGFVDGNLPIEPADFADLPVDRQALEWLSRAAELHDRAVASTGLVESRPFKPDQQQRMNRLLLEAVFPAEVRQLYVRGWRPVFIVYGLAGVVVALAFVWIIRDRPTEDPGCNAAEQALIDAGRPPLAPAAHDPFPWRAILTSQSLWMVSISQFATNIGWTFLITLLPDYLSEVHQLSVAETGWGQTLALAGGVIGTYAGGWFADWIVRKVGLRWGRALPIIVTRMVGMLAFVVCLFPISPYVAIAAFALVAAATDFGVPAIWAYNQDVGGRYVGAILGWGNMIGNFGSAVCPLLLSFLVGTNSNWTAAFLAGAIAFGIASMCGFFADATKPIRASGPVT